MGRKLSAYEAAMAAGGVEKTTGTPTIISAAVYVRKLPTRPALEAMCTEKLASFDSLAGQPKVGMCQSGSWEPVDLELSRHLFFTEVRYSLATTRHHSVSYQPEMHRCAGCE
jgi:hypothetical protein